TLTAFLFYLLAPLTGICAVAMVVTQNIVRAAAWLLFTLAATAGIFFLLAPDFVASPQLLLYVGGTLVRVVFAVIVPAPGPCISMKTGAAEWVIAAGVGLLLYGVLVVALVRTEPYPLPKRSEISQADREAKDRANPTLLGGALLGLREATPRD